ncbi:glutathione S-transferase [soil metagenome]
MDATRDDDVETEAGVLTLYGSKGSGSAIVEAALAILGTEYRQVDGAEWERSAGFEEMKSINPLAQIPTLVLEDGTVMTESSAILIHLGLVNPASGLLPADASRRASAIRGLVYITANCYAAIGVIDYPERWCRNADETTRQAIIAGTKTRLHGLWDVFADQFPATPWLAGEQAGALDILAGVVSRWSGARAHLAASKPAFVELLARIDTHPVLAPVWARHWKPS